MTKFYITFWVGGKSPTAYTKTKSATIFMKSVLKPLNMCEVVLYGLCGSLSVSVYEASGCSSVWSSSGEERSSLPQAQPDAHCGLLNNNHWSVLPLRNIVIINHS